MQPNSQHSGNTRKTRDWSKRFFEEFVAKIELQYFQEIDFSRKLAAANFTIDVLTATQKDLARRMRYVEERPALQDAYQKVHRYATTVIKDLFQKEKQVRSLFQAVEIYCLIRGRNIQQIAPLIARYRAYARLHKKIGKAIARHQKAKALSNTFSVKACKVDTKTPYLKVYCPVFFAFKELASILSQLSTVRIANVSHDIANRENLTVYPAKGCMIWVTEEAVKEALRSYFTGKEGNIGQHVPFEKL